MAIIVFCFILSPCYLYGMYAYGQAFYDLKNELQPTYDEREAAAIAHEVLLHITGLDKMQRLLQKETEFTSDQQDQYLKIKEDLLQGKPLQYIIGSTWFMGREFTVNEHVLIPRPETEELVQWVIDDYKNEPINILDIGTGSGCIPISLKLALPSCKVSSCDISEDAMNVAKQNANNLNADVSFIQADFLNAAEQNNLPQYNVIVSNPPYIPTSKLNSLHINVTNYEPHLALFVPDEEPLLFYKAIATFGRTHLKAGGKIYCELESDYAVQCKAMFEDTGYSNVEIKKDMHGNWRMIKASNKY